MTSITTLGYGLTVRVTDLITAAQAWPALEPTFQFFDLLFLRRRNGTLTSQGALEGLIEKVPVEVWENIKESIVMREMEDAEHRFLAPFLEWDEDIADGADIPKKKSWDYIRNGASGFYPGEWIYDDSRFTDMLQGFKDGDDAAFAPVHRLVAAFGLAHPLSKMISFHPEIWFDIDDVALLTIPSRAQRSDSSYSTISAAAGYDQQDEHTLVNVSLDLPPDANIRFSRFFRTFRLSVVEVSDATLRYVLPDPEAKGNSRKGLAEIRREGVRVVKEVKPRWMLYTSCWGDW
ncbi:uncharacterized protein JCM6883_001355 [Sporobolomyces salmoneus]|uniref:uncharacterized protein n=1 Tax=Sporobolomyces salmoneus TaxID=183962 RepID=UPI00317BDB73